jgi:hypothetical protein
MFLIGRCSCRVKDQNPGWDILMNTDWTQALAQATSSKDKTPTPEPSPPTKPQQSQATPVTVKTSPNSQKLPLRNFFRLSTKGFVHEFQTPNSSGEYMITTTVIFPIRQIVAISVLLALGAGFLFLRKKL